MRTVEECKAEILGAIYCCVASVKKTPSSNTAEQCANAVEKLSRSLNYLYQIPDNTKTDGVTISRYDFQKVIANAVNDDIMREIIENNPDIYGLLTDFGAIMANLIFESEEK